MPSGPLYREHSSFTTAEAVLHPYYTKEAAMSCNQKLINFLNANKIKYQVITHSRAYTAQEIAALVHIPGQELAKSVMVKMDGDLVMTVLPANFKINFELLSSVLGTDRVRLAEEDEFKSVFQDCEIGAMPPFGNLFNIPVYMAQSLENDEMIAFNAGSHTEIVRMPMEDYKRLVDPIVVKISEHV